MFVSFYLLILTLLLYFKNRKELFEIPKLTKHYSVSIMIPAYNEEDSIAGTVESVYALDYPRDKLQIIAVNDGSKDNTISILNKLKLKYPSLQILDKKNSGKADSLNQALKLCTGEIVVVVDADSYPNPDSLNKTVGFFDDDLVGAATVACIPRNKKTFLERLQVIEYKVIAFTRKILGFIDSIYVIPGPLGMYRKKAILGIGGFDTKNITEDIEATWHLAKDGWKIRMCLAGTVTTIVPNKVKPWYTQRRRWSLGGLQCLQKYYRYIFSHGMFGYFIIPFFFLGFLLGLTGIFIFLYILIRKIFMYFFLVLYSVNIGVPIIYLNELYFTPSVLNYFGIILFLLFFFFSFFVLRIIKDELLEKQKFFDLVFYMVVYLLIYPFVLITSIVHFIKGKRVWR